MRVAWSVVADNGSQISSYLITIKGVDGNFYTTSACNGADATIIANRHCDIPMSTLTALPFALLQNTLIVAKVQATNEVGSGLISDPNISGATIALVPHKPPTPPTMLTQSSTSISVTMPSVTPTETGGSTILSYHLEFKESSQSTYQTLVGQAPDNLL